MKKIFKIDDLCAYAYVCAIRNVYEVLDENIELEPLDFNSKEVLRYENIAMKLNLQFDEDGNIVR